ncbi:MAG: hypothetical protein K8R58_14820 [Bacteroidales bacterium]|nr:hypothetical protein [Bacteroidales bacterium]
MKKAFLFIFIALSSCISDTSNNSENILARVNDDYLYESELTGFVPKGTSIKDSIVLVKNFINNWVLQKLIIHKAEKNLTDEDKNFDRQLEDYRNSLIIYQYESMLISQNIDTLVTDTEIENYYNANINNFELKNNIVQVIYIKLNIDNPKINKIRACLKSDKEKDKDSFEKYCEEYAVKYFLDEETWVYFDDLLQVVPIKTYNQEAYLKNNRNIEITDDPFIYLVKFIDFKIKEGVSPLSFKKENIRHLIINKRKLNLIKKMRQELFENAMENNNFEIF